MTNEQFEKRIKELQSEGKKIEAEIKRLRKEMRELNSTEKIRWNIIAFQQRIYFRISEWSSPYTSTPHKPIEYVENFIKSIPNNEKKVAASLQELEKLKALPLDVAITKARSYVNNKSTSIRRNGNRWVCR